ncbi:MAG: CpaF family protein [Candidatus Omnitrophica bacterium]|nr:CpaF family protein [Candidatus Omnitrophota bacterium]
MAGEDLRDKVNKYLLQNADFMQSKDKMTEEQLRAAADRAINAIVHEQRLEITVEQRYAVIRDLVSAVVSLGPLRQLMEDHNITEIMVNGPARIYIQRRGKIELTDVRFDNQRQLMHTIQKILAGAGSNKRVDESSPFCDLSLSDGSRVNIIIPPCSTIGPVMTIRKFREDITTMQHLIELGEINQPIADLMFAAMQAKLNVVFCGSTGSGKTTALNVFSAHIPEEERIVTIEDTPELRLKQQHVVGLVSKPANIEGKGEITMRDLFINSLRMRPDRVIVGEVRGGEMLDMIESISSGHSGSLAIVHAETPEDCFHRMVTMMLMTGIKLRTEEIHRQIATAIDLIVHIELFMDGLRRVTYVTDLWWDREAKQPKLRDIFKFVQTGRREDGRILGDWRLDPLKPSFYHKLEKRMVALPAGFFDI